MREGTMYVGWEEERLDQVGSYTFEATVKEYTGEARNWNQQENCTRCTVDKLAQDQKDDESRS